MDKKIIIGIVVAAAVLLGLFLFFKSNSSNTDQSGGSTLGEKVVVQSPSPTPMEKKLDKPTVTIDTTKQYSALVKTDAGDITILLDTKNTPITANNFVYLATNHFYDDSPFHRTLPGFMIQGGDPTGTGMGGPGYRFDDEYLKGSYTRGTIAMANAGPNTNGSQFFIMHADYDLPNDYVIFGKVTAGLEVVDKIATAPALPNPGMPQEKSKPVTPVKIISVEIQTK